MLLKNNVPIPDRMKHLPKDPRGYPIPSNVLVDNKGKAHFAINDHEVREHHIKNELCPICAGKLLRGRWLVGGPASAFHEMGGYLDPPMHDECCHYALKVCPYLAAPSYGKRVDAKTLNPKDSPVGALFVDSTQIDIRPDVFVAIMHVGETYSYDQFGYVHAIKPKRPFRKIEYWQNGTLMSDADGKLVASEYMDRNKELYEDPSQRELPKLVRADRSRR